MNRFKKLEDRETLDRIKRWPQLIDRFDKVRIYSAEHRAYWRGTGQGYTNIEDESHIWSLKDAYKKTNHCGPEKQIQYINVEDDRRGMFKFNDHVYVEMIIAPEEMRSGLLVQVRKGCGQFGSDVYLIRLKNGKLQSYSNVMIRKVEDKEFVENFYHSNGMKSPKIEPQKPIYGDSTNEEYNIAGHYPAKGFIVENPKDPQPAGSFSMTITKG
jgi:phosphopantetheinyl transferase (holo-ACP synthase)